MTNPYIPARDSLFANWLLNFASLIAASPSTYGLVAADAAAISAQQVAWQAAYDLAIDPSTRTPAAVAGKDATRAQSEALVRPYAIMIRNNGGVSNVSKVNVGVTVPDLTPTPVPPPVTSPALVLMAATPGLHQLQFRDSLSPLLKRKPAGVIGLELFRAIGTVAATDPAQASYLSTITKTPFVVSTPPADAGKRAVYFARWATRSGPGGVAQVGPWSAALSTVAI